MFTYEYRWLTMTTDDYICWLQMITEDYIWEKFKSTEEFGWRIQTIFTDEYSLE